MLLCSADCVCCFFLRNRVNVEYAFLHLFLATLWVYYRSIVSFLRLGKEEAESLQMKMQRILAFLL